MATPTPPHGPIETREIRGENRFFLLGEELRAEELPPLEMLLANGNWLRGFFEYRVEKSFTRVATFSVAYHYASTSVSYGTVTVEMDVPSDALFRWPPVDFGLPLPPR